MNTFNQMNNITWTAIALSRCNNNQHRTSSNGDGVVMLLLLATAIIAIYIMLRRDW
jgi:hypothetical protein